MEWYKSVGKMLYISIGIMLLCVQYNNLGSDMCYNFYVSTSQQHLILLILCVLTSSHILSSIFTEGLSLLSILAENEMTS